MVGMSWVRVLVPLKTHHVERLTHVKSLGCACPIVDVIVLSVVPTQKSSSSLDQASELRVSPTIVFVLLYIAMLIIPPSLRIPMIIKAP
ncbi:hypothetical protein TNCV_1383741 [Trichonephila clavipes]|nr:hypothetical protein TNCV_1383741 [Trichonephila clavipes]